MSYENIQFTAEHGLGVVTLNRPTKRNALSLELMLELIQCFDEIGRNREIRAVILVSCPGDYVCFDSTLGIGVSPAKRAC